MSRMSVWACCPSARPVPDVERWASEWRSKGYKVAIWRDVMDFPFGVVDYVRADPYPGYAAAVNALVADVLQTDSTAEWTIALGDDIFPDPNHTADEIARELGDHFGGVTPIAGVDRDPKWRTWGVCQPTGDRYGEERHSHPGIKPSAYIDRVAGSAWIGREFAKRVNQGNGPLWPEYFHMGVDEELQAVATRLGVFWQRPDLTHRHEHWARKTGRASDMPQFLARANSAEEWSKYKALYLNRERAGFPGSEPL